MRLDRERDRRHRVCSLHTTSQIVVPAVWVYLIAAIAYMLWQAYS